MNGKRIGPYELIAEVGIGGMGTVFQAVNPQTNQIVAIKLLSPEYLDDLGLRAAFEREAKLVTGLKHEAIVPVYDFGLEAGQPYLVVQYMPNGSLADRLSRGALTPEEMLPILERLCQAVDYSHEQGIVHRDIKPSNILFDDNDQAYLADFGIARQTTTHLASSPIDGTPAYLSPEQALGEEDIDGRTDIYALGIVLYQALAGELPFDGPLPIGVILQQIHNQPPSLRAANWRLPSELDEVIQRALAKDPSDRYSNAGELVNAYRSTLSTKNTNPQILLEPQQQKSPSTNRPLESHPPLRTDIHEDPSSLGEGEELANGKSKNIWVVLSNSSSSASTPKGWQLAHLFALGFVTFIGCVLASGIVAFLHMPRLQTDSNTGFLLEYDPRSFILINQTDEPLNLSDLTFQRIATGNVSPAEFEGSRWTQLAGNDQSLIQPSGCYQLLLSDAANFSLEPGEDLPKVPGCTRLQGWLILSEPETWFWISEQENASFEVIYNNEIVQTCSIAGGNCRFTPTNPQNDTQ